MKPSILFVSHDANRAGAQLFLLNILEYFKSQNYPITVLFISSYGSLKSSFTSKFDCHFLNEKPKAKSKLKSLFSKNSGNTEFESESIRTKNIIAEKKIDLVYINTIASAPVIRLFNKEIKIPVLSHIHELEHSLQLYSEKLDRHELITFSDKVIACSNAVGENLVKNHKLLPSKLETVHSFVDNETVIKKNLKTDSKKIKAQFEIPENKFIVASCGNAEWRKGVDIFALIANQATIIDKDIHFIWIGIKHNSEEYEQINYDLVKMGIRDKVTLIPPTQYAIELITSSDVFLVSSREDPFPLVMLEAALCKKPILGFKNTGGCSEFVMDKNGLLANYLDISDLTNKLVQLKNHKNEIEVRGQHAKDDVLNIYNFDSSVSKIETIILDLYASFYSQT